MQTGLTPGKFTEIDVVMPDRPDGAQRGQIIALFAVFLIGLLGILGLATDVGYGMAARRAVQGAADAGAMNGARMIARYTDATPTSSGSEMELALTQNTFGGATPFALDCDYIGANWAIVGDCHDRVPANAVGARLQTKMIVHTFFLQVFPGVPDTYAVSGYAKARVEVAVNQPRNGSLMICGTSAWNVTANPMTTSPASASHMDILSGSNLRQPAVGQTFRIVDPQLFQAGNADCQARADKFSGIADTSRNNGKSTGNRFGYKVSNVVDPTSSKIDGAGGCLAGTSAPFNCVMIVPIAASGETTTNNDLKVVAFAAFKITSIGGGRYNATLLDNYIISGKGQNVWNRSLGGVVVVRLIW